MEICASELNTNLRSCCICESDQKFTKLISPAQPVEWIQLTSMYVCTPLSACLTTQERL